MRRLFLIATLVLLLFTTSIPMGSSSESTSLISVGEISKRTQLLNSTVGIYLNLVERKNADVARGREKVRQYEVTRQTLTKFVPFKGSTFETLLIERIKDAEKAIEILENWRPSKTEKTISWQEEISHLSEESFKKVEIDLSAKPDETIKIIKIDFPIRPQAGLTSYARFHVEARYVISNFRIIFNFGGNVGPGVGITGSVIYPGAPIIINSDGLLHRNLVEEMITDTKGTFSYKILSPLIVGKDFDFKLFFENAQFMQLRIADEVRRTTSCPWWITRNGTPIATEPSDPWIKSQLFVASSGVVACGESKNSRYTLLQDSFESPLLPQTQNGGFEELVNRFSEYSKAESAFNLVPSNVKVLQRDLESLEGKLAELSSLDDSLKSLLNQATAEAKAKAEAEAKAKAEAAKKKTTISCVKGKITKKVTAVNPKCPAGYKKK